MRNLKWLFLFVLLVTTTKQTFAQKQSTQLTQAVKTEVVYSLSSVLKRNYIYLDTAVMMSNYIKQRLKNGAYTNFNNPDDFARALKSDLYTVYRDLHMSVYYDPGWEKALRTKSYMESVTRRMNFIKLAKQQNWGFSKVEILDGNIGYISLTRFFDVNEQSVETIKSTFSFLKNADALVIDLRDNGGGEPDMVKYICSYFFKQKTHLNNYYERLGNKNTPYWTEPLSDSSFFSMPIYILVNGHTGSAAEEFSYDLQSLRRVTIIGQTTAGAAHGVHSNSISNGFAGNIPYMRAINPVTGKNWEKVGVKPDINSDEKNTLNNALSTAYNNQINTSKDTDAIKSAKWFRVIINSKLRSFNMSTNKLKIYTGNYKGRLLTLEKGQLYFTDINGYHIGLIPLSETAFTFTNNDHRIEFTKSANGKITGMNFIYPDGKVENFALQK